jgi:CRP/FNR family transcriptional regulator, cyclic AMP receptor protein
MSDSLFLRLGREFRAGDVLFREGEQGEEMFVIQSGLVQILKRVGSDERPLATLGRGEFLGEMAILNGKPRTATATVVEDARCLVIEARTLESMVARNAEIAIRLIKKLAKRLDSADALVEILMHRDPKARVMLALSRHAEGFGEEGADGIRVRTTAADLAREVGVDVTVADEVLRRLRLIAEEAGAIVVFDTGRLADFLEFLEMPQKFGDS